MSDKKTEKEESVNVLALNNPEPLREIDCIGNEYQVALKDTESQFEIMALTANAIHEIKSRLSDEMVMTLAKVKGTSLGFKTDENDGKNGGRVVKYGVEVFRDAFIQAAMRGVQLVGNEFNIIAKQFYITREGYTGLMRRDSRFSNVKIMPKVPVLEEGRAIVEFKATWTFNGREDSLEGEIPIKVNKMMGDDAILGKADRKIRHRVWNQATGDCLPEGDVQDIAHMPNVTPDKGELKQGSLIEEVSE